MLGLMTICISGKHEKHFRINSEIYVYVTTQLATQPVSKWAARFETVRPILKQVSLLYNHDDATTCFEMD